MAGEAKTVKGARDMRDLYDDLRSRSDSRHADNAADDGFGGMEADWSAILAPPASAGESLGLGPAMAGGWLAGPPSVAPTTPTTTAVSTPTGAPSWIANLKDASLRTDFTNFYSASPTITETEMATALGDLAAELTLSKTKLSTNQLADLKSIASNIGASMDASPYLQFITNALVNGNAANATWTGGAARSTKLGNLAAGFTGSQLDELTGKWFLGTDLPSSVVQMSGTPTFTVSYSAVSAPLYGESGPSINDINQGYLGDCYLLAALAEVAFQDPTAIESMITNNGDNTYGVRFYVNGSARYVTVDNQLADGGAIFNTGADDWASIVEEAYAEVQMQGNITGNGPSNANSFSTIGNGGYPEYTLEEITGATAITDFDASGSSWKEVVYNSSLSVTGSTRGLGSSTVASTIESDLALGDDAVLSSYSNATNGSGMTTLVADHALSIYGYDTSTGMLEIRNPWGTESVGQYWETTFEVSLSTLLSAGDTITVDNVAAAGARTLAA